MYSEYNRLLKRLTYLEDKRIAAASLPATNAEKIKILTADIEILRKQVNKMREDLCIQCIGKGFNVVKKAWYRKDKRNKCPSCHGLGHASAEVMDGIYEVKK